MTQLEEQLYSLIEDWVAALGLDGLDEVAGAIAETNYIFDEIYVEDIDFDKEDDSRYTFKCEISMTGEPRKDDVVFSGDTINVVIEGAVFFDEDEEAWVVDDDYDISAEVQDWGPEADDRQLSLKYARRQPGLKKISITNFKGIGPQVDIELKPVTLLFGPNSAGKSTILHAIHCAYTILGAHAR